MMPPVTISSRHSLGVARRRDNRFVFRDHVNSIHMTTGKDVALRLPPMQALRAFEAAAQSQSLTRAAQSLNLTHGAISHQIKSLERDLGVRLIERSGRSIRVTDEGER